MTLFCLYNDLVHFIVSVIYMCLIERKMYEREKFMKNTKIIALLVITALVMSSFAGCGQKDDLDIDSLDSSEIEITDVDELSEDETVETSEEPQKDVVEEETEIPVFDGYIVKPDEEIQLKRGDQLMVEGDRSFILSVSDIGKVAGGKLRVAFDGTENGVISQQVYFSLSEEEKQAYNTDADYEEVAGVYFPYKITITAGGTNVVTIKLSERISVKEPVVLSGNADEVYISDDYEYIETDMAFIYLDKDVSYPANLGQIIDDSMYAVEEATGYKFYPENVYCDSCSVNTANVYLGEDPWLGVNPTQNKVDIFFFKDRTDQGLVSGASSKEVILITQGILTEDGKVAYYDTLTHELTHVLFTLSTGECTSKIMNEGAAMYYEILASEKLQDKYPVNQEALEYNYGLPDGLNDNTAESLFVEDYQNDNSRTGEYRYGFLLYTYLVETYGDSTVNDFYDVMNTKHGNKELYDASLIADTLKEYYGDSIFSDFGKWYKDNKSKYDWK